MSVEEKVKEIIVDQLGVDDKQVTTNALFIDDLGAFWQQTTNFLSVLWKVKSIVLGKVTV